MFYRSSVFVVTLLALATTSNAEDREPTLPKNLLGFVEPGMHVAVKYMDGTGSVSFFVYDADEYAVALDILSYGNKFPNATPLASRHSLVRQLLDTYFLEARLESPGIKESDILIYPLVRRYIGTVQAVGDDFVLVQTEEKPRERILFSRSSIDRIHLDANPVIFRVHRSAGR